VNELFGIYASPFFSAYFEGTVFFNPFKEAFSTSYKWFSLLLEFLKMESFLLKPPLSVTGKLPRR